MKTRSSMFVALGMAASLTGCGALPEALPEELKATAKTALREAADNVVDDVLDRVFDDVFESDLALLPDSNPDPEMDTSDQQQTGEDTPLLLEEDVIEPPF